MTMNYFELKQLVKENSSKVALKWNKEYEKLFGLLDEVISGHEQSTNI